MVSDEVFVGEFYYVGGERVSEGEREEGKRTNVIHPLIHHFLILLVGDGAPNHGS